MNISIEHVTKKIKNATVLKDICLEMKGGTVYGLQGKNGSGKTMLMRAISGLIRPTSGRIVINGEQLHKNISIPRSIGLLLENPSLLPEYDAFQNLKLLAKMQGGVPEEEIRQLIRERPSKTHWKASCLREKSHRKQPTATAPTATRSGWQQDW